MLSEISAKLNETSTSTSKPRVQAAATSGRSHSSGTAARLLTLQRTCGNRYVQRLLTQQAGADCTPEVSSDIEESINLKRNGGQVLNDEVRKNMEVAFGHDFSGVRIHADSDANALNRALNARAFTTGQDIFLANGEYDPGSSKGRHLLAHELTHVVQQSKGLVRASLNVSEPGDEHELEAEQMATDVVHFLDANQGLLADVRLHSQINASDWQTRPARLASRASAISDDANRPVKGDSPVMIQGFWEELIGGIVGGVVGLVVGGPIGAVVGAAAGAGIGHLAAPGSPTGGGSGSGGGPAAPPPTPVTATVPAKIQASSSPAGMANRIPPRVDTSVAVQVAGWAAGKPPVTLAIEGASATNGTATINGAATADITANSTVNLKGVTQTAVGSGGNLKLTARSGGTLLGTSGGFSVSAIPQDYTDVLVSMLTGADRGFVVQDGWSSDSGTSAAAFSDLDKTEISEEVQYDAGTGCFAGVGKNNSGYNPGDALTTDTHGTPASLLTSTGKITANQTCKFKDNRTGSVDIPMKNSGYIIIRNCEARAPSGFKLTTSKNGAKATANGITSEAGTGAMNPPAQNA